MNLRIAVCVAVCSINLRGADSSSCTGSYHRGFYDPCVDVDCKFHCPDPGKRIVVADPRNCQDFFLCLNNRLIPQRCPTGQLFNSNYLACAKNMPLFNKCQPPCPNDSFLMFIDLSTTSTLIATQSSETKNDKLFTTTNISTTTSHFTAPKMHETSKISAPHETQHISVSYKTLKTTLTYNTTETYKAFETTEESDTTPHLPGVTDTSPVPEVFDTTVAPEVSETTAGPADKTSDKLLENITSSSSSSSSLIEGFSSSPSTEICVSLHVLTPSTNTTDSTGSLVQLSCTFSCPTGDPGREVFFALYRGSILLNNMSYNSSCLPCQTIRTLEDDDDDDDDDSSVKNGYEGISLKFPISTSQFYAGNYQCVVYAGFMGVFFSNKLILNPALKLTIREAQPYAISGEEVRFTCELRGEGGQPLEPHSCVGGFFSWSARAGKISRAFMINSSSCESEIQFLLDFEDSFLLSCQWTSGDFKVSNVSFVSTFIDDGSTCLPTFDDQNLFWNFTKVNKSSVQFCPDSSQAIARKSCVLDASNRSQWLPADLSECVQEKFFKILTRLRMIEEGSDDPDPLVICALMRNLSRLTGEGGLTPWNLESTTQSLKYLSAIRSHKDAANVSAEEIWFVMEVVSNILEGSNVKSWLFLRKIETNVATVLMRIIDLYLVKLLQNTEISVSNLVVHATPVTSQSGDVLELNPTRFDGISLNVESLKRLLHNETGAPPLSHPGNLPPTVFTASYTNLENILPVEQNGSFLASRILSVRTSNGEMSRMSGLMNITFSHTSKNFSSNLRPKCVFWDFSLGLNGDWSSLGCKVLWTNENATSCTCDHMTNFAILMTIDQEVLVDNAVIRTISLIGCIISIVGLVLTIIILSATWKRAKLQHHYALLTNLCVALLIANIVFIAGIDKTQPRELCITIATLLHFFYLASFFLMLAEGIQLILYVIHVFYYQRKWEIITIITSAWVMAAVVVGISLGISGTEGYGTSEHCWLSSSRGVIWAFVGPALFVILVNVCTLFVVLYTAGKRRVQAEKKDVIRSQIKRSAWNLLVISPLLGITWVFGLLSVSNSLVVFQYIFAVVNSLQGLFIFIFHGFCNQLRSNKASAFSGRKLSKSSSSKEDRQDQRSESATEFKGSLENSVQYEKSLHHEFHPPLGAKRSSSSSYSSSSSSSTDNEPRKDTSSSIYGSQSTQSSYVEGVQ